MKTRFQVPARGVCFLIIILATTMTLFAQAPVFRVLYSFHGGADGFKVWSGLAQDAVGNVYGTTYMGGLGPLCGFGCGTVWKLNTKTGVKVSVWKFGQRDGQWPMSGVVRDSHGNLYGTTPYGGANDCVWGAWMCGVLYVVSPSGTETVLHSFLGEDDGGFSTSAPVIDTAGNIYGQADSCGIYRLGCIYKVDPSGVFSIIYSFTGGADGGYPTGALLLDSAGNLYGTTGVIFKLDPSGNLTVLHSFLGGPEGARPIGDLTMDHQGNLYGVTSAGGDMSRCNTQGCGVLFKLDSNGVYQVLHSFQGINDLNGANGNLVLDARGNLYGTTYGGGVYGYGDVYMLDPAGTYTTLHSFNLADGDFPSAGLIMDKLGNLYGTTLGGGAYNGGVVFKIRPH